MEKRHVLGGLAILAVIIAIFLFIAPTSIDPDQDRVPDDVTGPGEEGMTATGSTATSSADPEVSPEPDEVTVTQ